MLFNNRRVTTKLVRHTMFVLDVPRQNVRPHESLRALVAFERVIFGVQHLVVLQIVLAEEPFRAEATTERLMVEMRPGVIFQLVFARERFLAALVVALEGFLGAMHGEPVTV